MRATDKPIHAQAGMLQMSNPYMFEWCIECDIVDDCYSYNGGRNTPSLLEHSCGEGPYLNPDLGEDK